MVKRNRYEILDLRHLWMAYICGMTYILERILPLRKDKDENKT